MHRYWNLAGAKQSIHSFLGGKGLGIQQRTSVWVGRPNIGTWMKEGHTET